jgi:plasmid maintenance system antidote protein VapI
LANCEKAAFLETTAARAGRKSQWTRITFRESSSGVSQIVNERRGITADTALRLARHFGTSADFWMNIQKEYELVLTRHKSLKTIERQVRRRTIAA